MADPRFYDNSGPLSIGAILTLTGASLRTGSPDSVISDVAALDTGGAGHLGFCEGARSRALLRRSGAAAFIVTEPLVGEVPEGAICLVSKTPALAFALVAATLYPDAGLTWARAHPPVAGIDPGATLHAGAVVAPGASVGYGAEIGRDTTIAPGAVIGRGVKIGSNCRIGPLVAVTHALIGDRVIIHSGTSIGQDGFGFLGGPTGHHKVPQLGRVVIDSDVEIGAQVAVDRGTLGDTMIGTGTRIDNLVQVGHNAVIGRHCILVSQVGIAGSVTVGDFVVIGGQAGAGPHTKIGPNTQIAARSGVTHDIEGGATYGGFPIRPIAQWKREVAAVARLAKGKSGAAPAP